MICHDIEKPLGAFRHKTGKATTIAKYATVQSAGGGVERALMLDYGNLRNAGNTRLRTCARRGNH